MTRMRIHTPNVSTFAVLYFQFRTISAIPLSESVDSPTFVVHNIVPATVNKATLKRKHATWEVKKIPLVGN